MFHVIISLTLHGGSSLLLRLVRLSLNILNTLFLVRAVGGPVTNKQIKSWKNFNKIYSSHHIVVVTICYYY